MNPFRGHDDDDHHHAVGPRRRSLSLSRTDLILNRLGHPEPPSQGGAVDGVRSTSRRCQAETRRAKASGVGWFSGVSGRFRKIRDRRGRRGYGYRYPSPSGDGHTTHKYEYRSSSPFRPQTRLATPPPVTQRSGCVGHRVHVLVHVLYTDIVPPSARDAHSSSSALSGSWRPHGIRTTTMMMFRVRDSTGGRKATCQFISFSS